MDPMPHDQFVEALEKIPDEVLTTLQFAMPWQYDPNSDTLRKKDEDGFTSVTDGKKTEGVEVRDYLQRECFSKFHRNPHVNTSIRGLVGRLTGLGFKCLSSNWKIQEEIDNIELDQRNRLYNFWPKYVGRINIEGELYLSLTLHSDGFVEIDFVDPGVINFGGDDGSGIIFHPNKTMMPLFYNIDVNGSSDRQQIPSIFIARYPELIQVASKHKDFKVTWQSFAKSRKQIFKKLGGYYRFIVGWDRGFITRRSVSYLRTVLEWLNHYENLKKYEIDHKKSSGSYTWVFSFEDVKAFRTWLSLTDEEKRQTAIMAPMTPGGKILLPPGMTLEVRNPNLTAIKEQDTDILQMIASGLNEPEDVLTGVAKGTFASVSASRGPMSDRTQDEIAYFRRFLKHDFWGNIFYLKAAINKFPETVPVKMAVDFDDNQEPVYKNIKRRPEMLIDIQFPVSEIIDLEARARALLGVKHGPIAETLGIPNSSVAEMLGISGYGQNRLMKATEDDKYPPLLYQLGIDAESLQETQEGEIGKGAQPAKPKPAVAKPTPATAKKQSHNGLNT